MKCLCCYENKATDDSMRCEPCKGENHVSDPNGCHCMLCNHCCLTDSEWCEDMH